MEQLAFLKREGQGEALDGTPDEVPEITHGDLVVRAARWLRNSRKCGVVLAETPSFQAEIPDAIGWCGGSCSILVECKAARADFLSDKRKTFRRCPERGMGIYRFYLAPPGIIQVDELPEFWGLLECRPTMIKVRKPAMPVSFDRLEMMRRERILLYRALSRVQLYGRTSLEGGGLNIPST